MTPFRLPQFRPNYEPSLLGDARFVVRFTRNWIHYGWMGLVTIGIVVSAVRALVG